MVLQRNQPLKFWGPGTPTAGLRVCLATDCAAVAASPGGGWAATLPARPASATPLELSLGAVQTLRDVVIGDVFLFSGQSNIDLPQSYAHQLYTPKLAGCQPQNDTNRMCSSFNSSAQDDTEQLADRMGKRSGLLRLMIVAAPPAAGNSTPALELPESPDCPPCPSPSTPYVACGCDAMKWARANASNVRGFSATAWFSGAALLSLGAKATAGVPFGLIRSSMGGTQIQLWSSPAALRKCGPTTAKSFWRPYSSLFANMIVPMRGLGFAGLTWYQGEANTGPDNPQPLNWGTGPTGVSAVQLFPTSNSLKKSCCTW